MTEHIYVNVSSGPLRVTLPSGAGYDLPPGHGIRGAFFARTAAALSGVFIPIEGCPKNMRPLRIHEIPGAPRPAAPPPPPPPAPAAPAKKEISTSSEAAVAPPEAPEPGERFREKTLPEWHTWLTQNGDASVLARLKSAEMQGLAAFMGVSETTLNLCKSKGDFLAAIRARVPS
jgi:hypothetical protein